MGETLRRKFCAKSFDTNWFTFSGYAIRVHGDILDFIAFLVKFQVTTQENLTIFTLFFNIITFFFNIITTIHYSWFHLSVKPNPSYKYCKDLLFFTSCTRNKFSFKVFRLSGQSEKVFKNLIFCLVFQMPYVFYLQIFKHVYSFKDHSVNSFVRFHAR